jgi:cold shock CspA family protein
MTVQVFVSYSHDSAEHDKRVLGLVDRLSREGISCLFDQYVHAPSEGWAKWMIDAIEVAQFVLVVCTEKYHRRSRNRVQTGTGKGVKFETLLTYQYLFDSDSQSNRLIPIVFEPTDTEHIPRPLKSFQYYSLQDERGYEELYRRLTNQPRVVAPPSAGVRALTVGENLTTSGAAMDVVKANSPSEHMSAQSKDVPAVANSDGTSPVIIELHIDRTFSTYSAAEQQALLRAITELMSLKDGEVRIKSTRPGSVILTLEVRADLLEDLVYLVAQGGLNSHHITAIGMPGARELIPSPGRRVRTVEPSVLEQIGLMVRGSSRNPAVREPAGTMRESRMRGARFRGVVKWFNDSKSFGFIAPEDGGKDILVHHSAIAGGGFRSLGVGERVEFEIIEDAGKAEAVNVNIMKQ